MDTYQLRGAHIGPQTILEISSDRHIALVKARHCLIDAGSFERRYELLMGNFLAFEEFCAVSNLRSELRRDWSYESGDALLMEANRHIVNLFTSGKTYVDQVARDFKSFGEEGEFARHAKNLASLAYDNSLAYRITCQLRDRSQHRALPVDGQEGGRGEHGLYAAKEKIAADRGKFKKSILDETPDRIYLRKILREYMQQVNGIHLALRLLVNAHVESSRLVIEAAIAEYGEAQQGRNHTSTTGIGLESCRYHGQSLVEAVPLLLNWDDLRLALVRKNGFKIRFDD
ncbi:hypothetical protein [Stenotrophomonas forensis]